MRQIVVAAMCAVIFAGNAFAYDVEVLGVCFSPGGGCEKKIVRMIDQAHSEVRLAAYGFTSAPIARALVSAHKRGVDVQVVLDEKDAKSGKSAKDYLIQARIPVLLDGAHAIQHNKYIVIDRAIVLTGSYNWTASANTRNGENVIFLKSAGLAQTYLNDWNEHKSHSGLMGYLQKAGQALHAIWSMGRQ